MIGTLPVTSLPPLEYRWAFDAVMPFFYQNGLSTVICDISALQMEFNQRLPGSVLRPQPGNGLWVEPMLDSWREDLQEFSTQISTAGTLVILASFPLARWLPERHGWTGDPLGLKLWGFVRLNFALSRAGFQHTNVYGLHSLVSIWLNYCTLQVDRCGRPELADRIRFSARDHYVQSGPFGYLSTVALLFYQKSR